nr:odorant-binding protein 3 [Gregopimpla kuwanae]
MFPRYFECFALLICFIVLLDNHADAAMTMEQMENAAKGFRNVCQPKTGADPAILEGMKRGEFPPDPKFQCYTKCVMTMLKSLKNGKPVLETLLKQINIMMPTDMHERTSAVARNCVTLDFNEDPCVAAWQFVKCQYETDPGVFFFP